MFFHAPYQVFTRSRGSTFVGCPLHKPVTLAGTIFYGRLLKHPSPSWVFRPGGQAYSDIIFSAWRELERGSPFGTIIFYRSTVFFDSEFEKNTFIWWYHWYGCIVDEFGSNGWYSGIPSPAYVLVSDEDSEWLQYRCTASLRLGAVVKNEAASCHVSKLLKVCDGFETCPNYWASYL